MENFRLYCQWSALEIDDALVARRACGPTVARACESCILCPFLFPPPPPPPPSLPFPFSWLCHCVVQVSRPRAQRQHQRWLDLLWRQPPVKVIHPIDFQNPLSLSQLVFICIWGNLSLPLACHVWSASSLFVYAEREREREREREFG